MRIILLALLTAAMLTACKKNDNPELTVTSTHQSVEISETGDTGKISFDSQGDNIVLTVKTNRDEWDYTLDADWCQITRQNNELTLSVAANHSPDDLTGSLIIFSESGNKRLEVRFELLQAGANTATLSLSSDSELVELNSDNLSGSVLFLIPGGTAAIDVKSGEGDWEAFSSNEGWCTLKREGDRLIITAKENITIFSRSSEITIRAGHSQNYAIAVITAEQPANGSNMIFDVYVHDGEDGTDNHLILPIDHTSSGALINCVIDWGDGSPPERYVTGYPEHQYSEAGRYDVSVTGTVTVLLGNYTTYFPTSYRGVIKGVKQWGRIGLQIIKYGFYYFHGLEYLAAPDPGSFADLTTLYSAFEGCENLKNIPEGMFENAPNLIEGYSVFAGCVSIEAIPDRVFAGCSKATRFSFAFKNLKSAKSIGKDVFKGCTSSTAYIQTFYQCLLVKEIPEGIFDDAALCTNYSYVFSECTALEKVSADIFAASPLVTNFSSAFRGCTGLTAIPTGLFNAAALCTNYSYVFAECAALEKIPADLFAASPLVTNFNSAFLGCAGLTAVPSGLFDAATKVENFGKTFSGCISLAGESPYTIIDNRKIHLYERDAADGFTVLKTFADCFKDCEGLSDYQDMETDYPDWI